MPPPADAPRHVTPTLSYPERLGRYRLLHQLGMGGMGVVFVGHDELLDRGVAIKFLFRREGPSDAHARLLREAQALARLAHPNVIAVHEVAEFEGYVFIVMELVVGQTMRAWLGERARPQAELLGVMQQAGQGLAALHAAGLVHRDVKPDNIMVGTDGRVRMMDFGLARAADDPPEAPDAEASLSSSSLLSVDVTRTGAMLGTPGYMAPEQYFRETPTPRSDIFSFCVVMFEAFHGKRPFAGDAPHAIRDAILRGEIRQPAGTVMPRWIDAVVRRGLIADPETRWPSMSALLAALADDPVARRRRLARVAAVLVLVSGLVALLVLAAVSFTRQRAQDAAERRAAEHLAALEQAVRRAEDAGDVPLAEAIFETFLSDAAHHGTRAFSGAWQLRGDRARAHGDLDRALAGYAHAYVHANAEADTTTALRSMAEVFHRREDGRELGQVLTVLRAREAVDPALELDAALLERDLPGAAAMLARLPADHPLAAWRPVLAPLQTGRPLGIRARLFLRLPPGHRAAFAADDTHVGLTLLDASLRPIDELYPEHRVHFLVPGTSWAQLSHDGAGLLVDLFDPGRPLWRGPTPLHRGIRLDLAGDPGPSLLVSRFSPHYGLRLLRGLGGPAPREQVAHETSDRANSELTAALVADLDGDGAEEVFVALGPWHAFSLQVFRPDADGGLTVVDRRRLGRIGALTVLRRGDERLLAAIKDDSCPTPDVFPAPPHTGDPAGIYLFRWTGRELADAGFVALPPRAETDQVGVFAAAADLDGDGVEELVFNDDTGRHTIGLARQRADGELEVQQISGARVLAVEQLDDDPAHELVITLDPTDSAWVVGAGDEPPPQLDPPPPPAPETPPQLTDTLLRERWSRAARLVALGLHASAATILEETGNMALDPRAGVHLLDRAAELHTERGALAAATAIDARIADDPELGGRALARLAAALLHSGRHEEAHAAARALQRHPLRTPEQEAAAASLLRELGPLVDPRRRIDVRFDGPLAPQWQLHQPGDLRRDPTTDTLRVMTASGQGALADLPFHHEGGPLALEVELDLHQHEFGACLQLDLLDERGDVWFGSAYCAYGGGGRLARGVKVQMAKQAWREMRTHPVASALTPERIAVRLTYLPDRRTADIAFDTTDHPGGARFDQLPAAAPGNYRLRLSATTVDGDPTLLSADVRRLSLRGARLVAPDAGGELDVAARLLVEGEPAAALRALDGATSPRAELIRLLASDELRDAPGLARALAALRPHLADPAWRPALALLLRTRPAAAAALHAELGPALLPLLRSAWLVLAPHRMDAALRRIGLVELRLLDILAPVSPDELSAARALLAIRGDMHAREGDLEHAHRDIMAALALPPVDAPDDIELRRTLHVNLVRLSLATAPRAAYEHAAAALKLGDAPELTRDQLLELPGVASFVDVDPRWRQLLRP